MAITTQAELTAIESPSIAIAEAFEYAKTEAGLDDFVKIVQGRIERSWPETLVYYDFLDKKITPHHCLGRTILMMVGFNPRMNWSDMRKWPDIYRDKLKKHVARVLRKERNEILKLHAETEHTDSYLSFEGQRGKNNYRFLITAGDRFCHPANVPYEHLIRNASVKENEYDVGCVLRDHNTSVRQFLIDNAPEIVGSMKSTELSRLLFRCLPPMNKYQLELWPCAIDVFGDIITHIEPEVFLGCYEDWDLGSLAWALTTVPVSDTAQRVVHHLLQEFINRLGGENVHVMRLIEIFGSA